MRLLIARLGELGMGLTWGWLLARFTGSGGKSQIISLALAAASLFITAEVFLFSDWRGAALFIGAAAGALLLRLGWHRELERRFHS